MNFHSSRFSITGICVLAIANVTFALNNGNPLPPMGWSTWNTLKTNFDETILQHVANSMVASGMVSAGYRFLNIDDGWPEKSRASDGSIVVNPQLFPSGMQSFASFLASVNMTLGIYTAHCFKTCQGYPGSYGYEAQDAKVGLSLLLNCITSDYLLQYPNLF